MASETAASDGRAGRDRRRTPSRRGSTRDGERPAAPEEDQHVGDAPRAPGRARTAGRWSCHCPSQRLAPDERADHEAAGRPPDVRPQGQRRLVLPRGSVAARSKARATAVAGSDPGSRATPYFGRGRTSPAPMPAARRPERSGAHDHGRRTHQDVRRLPGRRRHQLRRPARTGHRLPRAQRCRQDHHDARSWSG